MNHTFSAAHSNTLITHTGELEKTTQVLAMACKDIAQGLEIFANYGPKDKIIFFDIFSCNS